MTSYNYSGAIDRQHICFVLSSGYPIVTTHLLHNRDMIVDVRFFFFIKLKLYRKCDGVISMAFYGVYGSLTWTSNEA